MLNFPRKKKQKGKDTKRKGFRKGEKRDKE